MKKGLFEKVSLGFLLGLLIASIGCCVNIGCGPRAKYKRQVQLSAPLQAGSTFVGQTHNGSIKIEGADVTDCNLTATIIAQAPTEEEAKKLAEETEIKLEPSGDKLIAQIKKPASASKANRSVSVSLDVTIPHQTNLELTTHNGAVRIANINGDITGTTHNGAVGIVNVTGQVSAKTHNGKVTAENISGTTDLQTHNGSVVCEELSGNAQLRTYNGSVKLYYCETAPAVCDISVITHNGGIDLTTPPNFSAAVKASTHNGSIKTKLPIMVTGEVSRGKLTGTIGTGQGKLHLQTYNGSIKIK